MIFARSRGRHNTNGASAASLLLATLALISLIANASAQTAPSVKPPQTPPAPTESPAGQPQQRPRQTGQTSEPSSAIENDDEIVRVNSNLVVVPVSVTDANGYPVSKLRAQDFKLDEEGRTQEIAQVGDADQVPLELAILLDVSGSVKARFAFEQEAAARFLKAVLRPADHAVVYAIDSTPHLVGTRASADGAATTLMNIVLADGPTAFYDTVVDAARYLTRETPPQHRRVIVVISDGEDTFSASFKEAASALPEVQRADAVFYSINPTGPSLRLNRISVRGQDGMRQLAEATGGTAFVPEALESLDAEFRQIAAELRAQYLVQYYSNSEAPNGKYLHIKVQIPAQPALRIRARQGYYVHRS